MRPSRVVQILYILEEHVIEYLYAYMYVHYTYMVYSEGECEYHIPTHNTSNLCENLIKYIFFFYNK